MEKPATKTPINITKNEFQIKHNKKKAIIREQAEKKILSCRRKLFTAGN